jgi:hypothetical protein
MLTGDLPAGCQVTTVCTFGRRIYVAVYVIISPVIITYLHIYGLPADLK